MAEAVGHLRDVLQETMEIEESPLMNVYGEIDLSFEPQPVTEAEDAEKKKEREERVRVRHQRIAKSKEVLASIKPKTHVNKLPVADLVQLLLPVSNLAIEELENPSSDSAEIPLAIGLLADKLGENGPVMLYCASSSPEDRDQDDEEGGAEEGEGIDVNALLVVPFAGSKEDLQQSMNLFQMMVMTPDSPPPMVLLTNMKDARVMWVDGMPDSEDKQTCMISPVIHLGDNAEQAACKLAISLIPALVRKWHFEVLMALHGFGEGEDEDFELADEAEEEPEPEPEPARAAASKGKRAREDDDAPPAASPNKKKK